MEQNDQELVEEKPKKVKKLAKRNSGWYVWPIKIFFLSFALSLIFSISSEYLMSTAGIVISTIVVFLLMTIAVITDMIGVSVTACSPEPFTAMASRKVKGAKEALMLIKNADKVASLSADVMGDVCSILSGAAGAAIVAKLTASITSEAGSILVASLVSAFIAGLTIFGKAISKKISIDKCDKIVLLLGKIISPFTKKNKQK